MVIKTSISLDEDLFLRCREHKRKHKMTFSELVRKGLYNELLEGFDKND